LKTAPDDDASTLFYQATDTTKGEFRLVVTDPLKRLLNQRVQRRYSKPADRAKRAAVLGEIMAHRYVLRDSWSAAEERHRVARAERCLQLLEGLRIRLERGETRYEGLEDATGRPRLGPAQLRDHSLRLLDLSPDWLLVSVARHPEGGSGAVRRQYWLYDRHGRVLHLLHAETVARMTDGGWKVQKGTGPWRDPDDAAERDFLDTLARLLGPEACDVVRLSSVPADRLAHPPPEVLTECQRISGIDYPAEEAARSERRERGYRERYGPRQKGLLSISTASIELIYADE